jgi:hypothetical protein
MIQIEMTIPTAVQVVEARAAAGLTMREACQLADITHASRWAEYEQGRRRMTAARWLMFQLRTDQHPHYRLTQRRAA